MKDDLTILCVSNKRPEQPYYCYDEFFASCRKFGFEPVVVGDKPGEYGGLGSRPRLVKKAIETGLVPTKYMLFADCWDIVFAVSPEEVLRWYLENRVIPWRGWKAWPAKILWNAEKHCFPDATLASKHPPTTSPFRYMNSGFAIGETEGFLRGCIEMNADDIPDDHTLPDGTRVEPCCQDYWMRQLIFGTVPMGLDHQTAACIPLCGVTADELDLTGERIINRVTGAAPMAFHFNGPAKTAGLLEPILRKLGYER